MKVAKYHRTSAASDMWSIGATFYEAGVSKLYTEVATKRSVMMQQTMKNSHSNDNYNMHKNANKKKSTSNNEEETTATLDS